MSQPGKKGIRAGILYFPGTNCERDLVLTLEQHFGVTTELLWHTENFPINHDIYFVPGGFSYGDYLRSGALAARSVSMRSLKEAASKGRMIVGICNGFQILTEAELLPGALIRNEKLKHICRWVKLEAAGKWKSMIDQPFRLPVSHSEGNYIASEETLKKLHDEDLVLLKYVEAVNGSMENIAGISDQTRRIIGLMPHPERAMTPAQDFSYSKQRAGNYFFDALFQKL